MLTAIFRTQMAQPSPRDPQLGFSDKIVHLRSSDKIVQLWSTDKIVQDSEGQAGKMPSTEHPNRL